MYNRSIGQVAGDGQGSNICITGANPRDTEVQAVWEVILLLTFLQAGALVWPSGGMLIAWV